MAPISPFEAFKAAWQAEDYSVALAHIDAVIADKPQVAALHWYRANCLERLQRRPDALAALTQVLALNPDHVAALVRLAELDWGDEADSDIDEDALSPAQREQLQHTQALRVQRHEALLRRAVAADPQHAEAHFALAALLRHAPSRSADAANTGEADVLLDRAIALAPQSVEYLDARATLRRSRALQTGDGSDSVDCVTTFAGLTYSRRDLELALADYARAAELDGGYRFAMRMGSVLHDLGRFDDALAQFDRALRLVPADAPTRAFILEMRERSENNGMGEREQMARLLESGIGTGDRNLADDMAARAMLGAADAVRQGRSVQEALAARLPESPDDFMAANIAQQILGVAHEPAPNLVSVDAASFPAYQRKHADSTTAKLRPLGLQQVCDVEATGMTRMLGQRVLLRVFSDSSGEIGVASFALKPKWPGLVGFVLLLLSGKWKVHTTVECITQFDDDMHLTTQFENISPFRYAGKVDVERIARARPLSELLARHSTRVEAYKQQQPRARALVALDIDGVEQRWLHGQRVKLDYRRSVGYATDEELRGLLGTHYARLGDRVRQKLLELAPDAS